jgi:S-adenosylmethionine:tRNA ribosyltransferase-isomerase
MHPGQKLKPGAIVRFEHEAGVLLAEVLERLYFGRRRVRLWSEDSGADIDALVDAMGHVPLPPYIHRADADTDRARYQTVYARVPGAIAAPTAGLHWTPDLLSRAQAAGVDVVRVVLHVGPGTFKPVAVEDPAAHVLDPEWYEIPPEAAARLKAARLGGGRVIAVGTTVARTLETGAALADPGEVVAAGSGWTDRLIVPPYSFRGLDALVTNFHLPRSSLLFLVSALAGREHVLAAYQRAIDEGFRFYSYGDAMVIA